MKITIFAAIDLVLLLLTAGFGSASLVKWSQHRGTGFPVAKISTHIMLQAVAFCVWIAFIATGNLLAAWLAFAALTAGQVFGELLMFASHRARHPELAGKATYTAVGGDVLSFRRPLPALHALIGAVAWFGMLAICIVATAIG